MNDIVERLRKFSFKNNDDDDAKLYDLLSDAADQVEEMKGNGAHLLHQLDQAKVEIKELKSRIPEPSVNRLYRAINGLDGDDADERARIFIASALEGQIPEQSRAQVQLILAQNFEELYQRVEQKAAEIERLREALEDYQGRYSAQTTNPADQQTP